MNTWVTGTSANCPIEPPAVRMPSTRDRFSAGTMRETEPMTVEMPAAPIARPTSRLPAITSNGPEVKAISTRPAI